MFDPFCMECVDQILYHQLHMSSDLCWVRVHIDVFKTKITAAARAMRCDATRAAAQSQGEIGEFVGIET